MTQRYQSTKTSTGHMVIDTKTGKTIAGPFGPSRARREAQWHNHAQTDRNEWNSSESQFAPRYPAPVNTVSRLVYRDGRAVWTSPGHYNTLPLYVNN